MTKERQELACDIATGLSGWYQLQLAQGFGDFFGEDSAQLTVLQIINSQRNFAIEPSHPFKGYEDSQARLDIVLKSRGAKKLFYGAVEMKWLGASNPGSSATRSAILDDALRLTVVKSSKMKANLLVVGGQSDKFKELFGENTRQFQKTNEARALFKKLFQTEVGEPGTAGFAEIKKTLSQHWNETSKARIPLR